MTETKLLKIRIKLEALIGEREMALVAREEMAPSFSQDFFGRNAAAITALLKEFEEPERTCRIVKYMDDWTVRAGNNFEICLLVTDSQLGASDWCKANGWEVVE